MRLFNLDWDAAAPRPRLLLLGVSELSQAIASEAGALGFEVFLSAASASLFSSPSVPFLHAAQPPHSLPPAEPAQPAHSLPPAQPPQASPVVSSPTQAPCIAIPGVRYVQGRSDDVVHGLQVDANTAVLLAPSSDAQADDLALFEALECHAFYVGVLHLFWGQERCKQRLAEYFDLPERTLAKLHHPLALMDPGAPCALKAQWILQALVFCKNAADAAEAALLQAHPARGDVPARRLESAPL